MRKKKSSDHAAITRVSAHSAHMQLLQAPIRLAEDLYAQTLTVFQ